MNKRFRRVVVVTLAVLVVPVGIGRIQSALACSCLPEPRGYEGDVVAAAVVFDAIAIQQFGQTGQSSGSVTFRFDVSNVVKGSVTDPQDVTTSSSGSLCGVSFDIGRVYRVFAHRSGDSLSTGLCSGNRLLTGYRLAAADGGVFSFGASSFSGSAGGLALNAPVVGIAATPTNRGYWLVAADGGVFAYGDARFFGSAGGRRLNARVVGITASPTGLGYWLTAADGGVFAYGDARFFGSTGGLRLVAPVTGIAATGSGAGYWLVGADGGVFAFGDARYQGRVDYVTGAIPARPTPTPAASSAPGPAGDRQASGIAASNSGTGYWITSYYGGAKGFGDTSPLGPFAFEGLFGTVGVARTSVAPGMAIASFEGRVRTSGGGHFGDLAGLRLNAPVVGISG